MAIYVYKCKLCEQSFEESYKIDEREMPLQHPCPFCEKGELFIDLQPCGLSFKGLPHKTAPEWYKDRLREAKKKFPKNTINIPN